MSASMEEVMTLPFGWKESNIIAHNELNYYLIEGIAGSFMLTVQKCVDCHLQVGYGSDLESIVSEEMEERVFKREVTAEDGYLFVKITSNNYAFYSIVAQEEAEPEAITLENPVMSTYITEPDSHLELEFIAPKCGQSYC